MLGALRRADFRRLFAAGLISGLGSWLLVVAVPFHVYELTGSVSATGLTLAAEFVPALLVGPIAGVFVDRWDRGRLMIAMDLLRAGAVALLLLADRPSALWLVYVALAAEKLGTVFFRPASRAMVPAVVGTGADLAGANAATGASDGIVRLVGPPLGAVLLTWSGYGTVVLLDVASYLVSAVILLRLTKGGSAPRAGLAATVRELRDGLAHTARDRALRALFGTSTLFLAANAVFSALLVPLLHEPYLISTVLSALGIGYLLGAPLGGRLARLDRPGAVLAVSQVAVGCCFALLAHAHSPGGAVLAGGLIGIAGSALLVTLETTVQQHSPDALRGRIGAAFFTGEAAATLLGALTGTGLGAHLGLTTVLDYAVAAIGCSAALALAVSTRRSQSDVIVAG